MECEAKLVLWLARERQPIANATNIDDAASVAGRVTKLATQGANERAQ